MKKVFYLVAASMLMTSCLKDRAIEAYNEDFVSVFGDTDPLHTWKMVENQAVEVNLDKPSQVKIYVKAGNSYRLAADYENVSGTQNLTYDAPMGCEDILVTVDGVPTQGVNSRTDNQEGSSAIISDAGYRDLTFDLVKGYYNNFRRTSGNLLPEEVDNRDKVTFIDYKFVSNGGTYTFYPIYWGGSFYHRYGLYYYDGDQIEEVTFIDNHKDPEEGLLQYQKSDNTWESITGHFAYDQFFNTSGNYQSTKFQSKCFQFTLSPGTVFGFYVDIKDNNLNDKGRYYSEAELNTTNQNSAFAYYQKSDNISYITVEDKFDDNDYNDFVFVLEGTPTPVVKDPIKYIYAVEDLGGTNDFDFNDVVFSVSHINGQPKATVQPLAAGGIYPAQIYFKGEAYGEEIHKMFGKTTTKVLVNTKAGTTKNSMVKAEAFEVPVDINWSQTATKYGESGNGFSVWVDIPDRVDKEVFTCDPGTHAAPQMLVLSEDWLWPTETTRISYAYPGFETWGENYTEKNWAKTYNSKKVVNWKE